MAVLQCSLGNFPHPAFRLGREFSYALVRAVSRLPEDELQAALGRLVASELVFQRGIPPEAVYSFKHALVKDAAHGSLLRSSRQQLHAQIAEALETELMDSQPELLAPVYGWFTEGFGAPDLKEAKALLHELA